ncbi:MAG: hypothetical protein AB1798_21170 [Spirochaetota bacterium]
MAAINPAWGKVRSAAAYAGVSTGTARSWLREGLPFSRLPSGTILVRFTDIDNFLARYREGNKVDILVQEIIEGLK